jgi:energy-coupling factor transport system ATP-binding protein
MEPGIVVLDEPTVGLDALGQQETLKWLAELKDKGCTIVLISHNMSLAAQYGDRILVLDHGQLIADGAPDEVFRQEEVLEAASLAPPPVLVLAQTLAPFGLNPGSLTIEAFCEDYVAVRGNLEPTH